MLLRGFCIELVKERGETLLIPVIIGIFVLVEELVDELIVSQGTNGFGISPRSVSVLDMIDFLIGHVTIFVR